MSHLTPAQRANPKRHQAANAIAHEIRHLQCTRPTGWELKVAKLKALLWNRTPKNPWAGKNRTQRRRLSQAFHAMGSSSMRPSDIAARASLSW